MIRDDSRVVVDEQLPSIAIEGTAATHSAGREGPGRHTSTRAFHPLGSPLSEFVDASMTGPQDSRLHSAQTRPQGQFWTPFASELGLRQRILAGAGCGEQRALSRPPFSARL